MKVWIVVIASGAGSYLFRVSMLVLAARVGVPPVLERAVRFAVPAAFAALVAASLSTTVTADPSAIPRFSAIAVAALTVQRTGSPPSALLVGLPTLWILSAVVPA